jgi:hypothetical protein
MDVFQEYKSIRNKINLLSIEEALGVIWAYGQYLQIDNFNFSKEIEVINEFLQLDVPQRWVSEWELELLAKEVIINGRSAAKKGQALRKWKTLSDIINSIKGFEGRIYKTVGSPDNVLVELIRIVHRQFIWQANPPNSAAIIRLSLSQTSSGWQLIENQAILLWDEGSLQTYWLDNHRFAPVAGNA